MNIVKMDISKIVDLSDKIDTDVPISFICGYDSVKQIGIIEPKEGINIYLVKVKEIKGTIEMFTNSIKKSVRIKVSVIPDGMKYNDYIKRILDQIDE